MLINKIIVAVPAKANQPQQTSSSSSAISLSWKHVIEGNVTKTYTVTWNQASSANVQSKSGITGTSTTITGLESNTVYSFTLAAVNEAGSGKFSNAILIQTGKTCSIIAKFNFKNVVLKKYPKGEKSILLYIKKKSIFSFLRLLDSWPD